MTTIEKDIKSFVQSYKPSVTNNDKFMSELIRQIDMLPVPASMHGKTLTEEQQKQIAALFAKNLKSVGIRQTLLAILFMFALWTIIFIALYMGFASATSFLQSNGIPMAEIIISAIASIAFTLPAVYILRTI